MKISDFYNGTWSVSHMFWVDLEGLPIEKFFKNTRNFKKLIQNIMKRLNFEVITLCFDHEFKKGFHRSARTPCLLQNKLDRKVQENDYPALGTWGVCTPLSF